MPGTWTSHCQARPSPLPLAHWQAAARALTPTEGTDFAGMGHWSSLEGPRRQAANLMALHSCHAAAWQWVSSVLVAKVSSGPDGQRTFDSMIRMLMRPFPWSQRTRTAALHVAVLLCIMIFVARVTSRGNKRSIFARIPPLRPIVAPLQWNAGADSSVTAERGLSHGLRVKSPPRAL